MFEWLSSQVKQQHATTKPVTLTIGNTKEPKGWKTTPCRTTARPCTTRQREGDSAATAEEEESPRRAPGQQNNRYGNSLDVLVTAVATFDDSNRDEEKTRRRERADPQPRRANVDRRGRRAQQRNQEGRRPKNTGPRKERSAPRRNCAGISTRDVSIHLPKRRGPTQRPQGRTDEGRRNTNDARRSAAAGLERR